MILLLAPTGLLRIAAFLWLLHWLHLHELCTIVLLVMCYRLLDCSLHFCQGATIVIYIIDVLRSIVDFRTTYNTYYLQSWISNSLFSASGPRMLHYCVSLHRQISYLK